ncbi:protein kinase [Acidobacteriota bacterium]
MSLWDIFFSGRGDKRVSEAKKALRRHEYDRAGDLFYMAEKYEDAIQSYLKGGHHKRTAPLYEKLGKHREAADCYLKARDYHKAASLLAGMGETTRAIQIYETHGEFFRAAHLCEALKRFTKAAMLYMKAGYFERASHMFAKAENFGKAADALSKYIQKVKTTEKKDRHQPDNIDIHQHLNTLAQYYEKASMPAQAAVAYEHANQLLKAAQNYELTGNFASAIRMNLRIGETAAVERLLHRVSIEDLEPELAGQVLVTLGRHDQAGQFFDSRGEYRTAAGCYERAGDRKSAALAYEKAGEDGSAGELWLNFGEYQRAADLLLKAGMWDLAAEALRKCGRHREAAETYLTAGDEVKSAEVFLEIGDNDRSIDILQRMQAAPPDPSSVALLLAENFRAKGLDSLAVEKYKESIGEEPVNMGNLRSFYGLALCYEAMNHPEQAAVCLEKVMSIDYGFADVQSRLESIRQRITPVSTPSPTGITTILKNRYEVNERVATEYGPELFRCWDRDMARSLQVERMGLKPEDESSVRRSIDDARSASKLVHTNIVMIYDVFEEKEAAYICKEAITGKTLRLIIQEGGISTARFNDVALQMTQALDYAHREGVLHRNLNPDNIFITEAGTVKIDGFGHEKGLGELSHAGSGTVLASSYAAPEQFKGMPLDKRSDIFSLGACLYELVMLSCAFPKDPAKPEVMMQPPVPVGQIKPDLPQNLQNVIMKSLEFDPDRRYQSTKQIIEDLRTVEIIPGMVISDRYELLNVIGSGGMGKIFKALDRELEEVIVLKLLRSEFGLDPVIEQRFVREIKLSRKVVHPGIVSVFDIGKWNGMRYITMEFIEGVSLERWIEEHGHRDIDKLLTFTIQIAEALHAAHKVGVVHRDIKPQNIIINREGRTKIVDFGIARMRAASELTSTGQLIGSPKYMSPEQIRGEMLDHRTDIYSLGVLMYFMFAGREPITGDSPNTILMKQIYESPIPPCQVNPELPPWLELIITKAMAKDINLRYKTVDGIVADFKRFMLNGGFRRNA